MAARKQHTGRWVPHAKSCSSSVACRARVARPGRAGWLCRSPKSDLPAPRGPAEAPHRSAAGDATTSTRHARWSLAPLPHPLPRDRCPASRQALPHCIMHARRLFPSRRDTTIQYPKRLRRHKSRPYDSSGAPRANTAHAAHAPPPHRFHISSRDKPPAGRQAGRQPGATPSAVPPRRRTRCGGP